VHHHVLARKDKTGSKISKITLGNKINNIIMPIKLLVYNLGCKFFQEKRSNAVFNDNMPLM
jgi:hypothetical protein